MVQQTSTDWKPTEGQRRFVEALLGGDKPVSIADAARQAGVDRSTPYKTWFKDPDFMRYLNERREAKAKAWKAHVDHALIAKCLKGDIAAIKLFYERFDDLVQRFEHKGNITHTSQYSYMTDEELENELEKYRSSD